SSVHGVAVLNALDRRAAADELRRLLSEHDVVLLDRYVASNAAYGAARLCQDAHGDFVQWVEELEQRRFAVPAPDHQVLLRVPTDVAAQRAEHREQAEVDRKRDVFESDGWLQRRCAELYSQLAERDWWSPWTVVDGVGEVDFAALAQRCLEQR